MPEALAEAAVDPQKLALAREFSSQLAKGLKTIGMYRHMRQKYGEFLQKAHGALIQYTTAHGPLSLKVDTATLSLSKEPVYQGDTADNIAYRLYREGIRQLIIRPDFTIDELVKFVLIVSTDTQRGGEDILSQLWKAAFEHLDYILVEGFALGEASEEEVQVEVDEVVGYLYSRLKAITDDSMSFARLQVEDLDLKMEGVEQIRGAVLDGPEVPDTVKQGLQEALHQDESRLFGVVAEAIIATLEAGALKGAEQAQQLLEHMLDALLLQEDLAGIAELRAKLAAQTANPAHAELSRQLLSHFQATMGDEQRLRQLLPILEQGGGSSPDGLKAYLSVLDQRGVGPLLSVLDVAENPQGRKILIEVLSRIAKDSPDLLAAQLHSDKSQLVRDVLEIIERCNFRDKLKYFAEALTHQNPAVRLEVLSLLARSPTEASKKLLVSQLNDPSSSLRTQVAKSLAIGWPDVAIAELLRIVRAPDFEKRDLEERKAWFEALGTTGHPGALGFFHEVIKRKSLLNKKRIVEDKLCAIAGLVQLGGVPGYKALEALHADPGDDEVKAAAMKAKVFVKRQVFGA